MFWLMRQFYLITRNYGIAIILLTIVVRVILFYPSLKSATAMEEMKKIQPQLVAVREKFKKDPQRMNQEMMKLYKEHKVNPWADTCHLCNCRSCRSLQCAVIVDRTAPGPPSSLWIKTCPSLIPSTSFRCSWAWHDFTVNDRHAGPRQANHDVHEYRVYFPVRLAPCGLLLYIISRAFDRQRLYVKAHRRKVSHRDHAI
jgi:hypothetical protein